MGFCVDLGIFGSEHVLTRTKVLLVSFSFSLPGSALSRGCRHSLDGGFYLRTALPGATSVSSRGTNEQSDPLYIYASRVNDGVCDCCDGSDEWQAMTEGLKGLLQGSGDWLLRFRVSRKCSMY